MSAPTVALTEPAVCVNCRQPLQGAYCHRCGEKRLDQHDYALGHFLEHAVDTVTHFDLKVVKGIWSLLGHPGRMTHDVLAGRRVPWPKPLQLFLIVNLLFVFAAHQLGLQVFNTPWRFHVSNWYGPWAAHRMEALASRRGTTVALLAKQFDAKADLLSKSLIIAFIPLLALLLTGLLWRQRRYFLEHVITATHLMSLILLVELVLVLPISGIIWLLNRSQTTSFELRDMVATLLITIGIAAWSAPLLRRTYGGSWPAATARAVVVAVGFFWLLVNVYRLLLFFATYSLL